MKRTSLLLLLVLSVPAYGWERTSSLLARAWPDAGTPAESVSEIGAGIGVVFTPDLSVPGNCRFYATLGFACFESADWLQILSDIHAWNLEHTNRRIRTLVLETHGTNGNGLKLQTGKRPGDERSYVSVAALQELLEPVGVRYIVLSACNSGRLLRPEIYRRLNRDPGDKLFLPPTRGIIDATPEFDARRTQVTVITPGASHIENTLVGSLHELAPSTRRALQDAAKQRGVKLPKQFAISELLIQMMLRDPYLELRTGESVDELSKVQTSVGTSERLFGNFIAHLNYAAAHASGSSSTARAAR